MSSKLLITFLTKLFGSQNERTLHKLGKIVDKINALEPEYERLSDGQLRAKTDEFRKKLKQNIPLSDLTVEAFATVREASKRTLGLRHFDVQLLGGLVLIRRSIAEMRTGEGKTLTSTLPGYLYALAGKGVHIVTVNEYLAQRDEHTNKKLFEFLGITTGVILNSMTPEAKRQAYHADITYGTSSEFCFDYLRDNMIYSVGDRMQRTLHYALLDEVDSILIDEARTPLIISGFSPENVSYFSTLDKIIPKLIAQEKPDTEEYRGKGDYYIEAKFKQAHFTERGLAKLETFLRIENLLPKNVETRALYTPEYLDLMHYAQACLKAHTLFFRNIDYMVHNDEILIVDENTGRVMKGRRWSDGIHQAIETKEGLTVKPETDTQASISYQNYFRLYQILAGMTGTADTEAFEFSKLYEMDTVVVPTNRPMNRLDKIDKLCIDHAVKLQAIVDDIKAEREKHRPILVGTTSIERSEELSALLHQHKIPHQVLNARYPEKEAEIIAQAGSPKTVTLATNMAGRGTDIILGGNIHAILEQAESCSQATRDKLLGEWEKTHKLVVEAGGLHVIGTERHDSRRIDNQLRGRSGRQGDPGSSCFYVSLNDPLMKNFLPDNVTNLLLRTMQQEPILIDATLNAFSIQKAQRLVESRDFDTRKRLLEFDDVANEHRKVIYKCRNLLLEATDLFPSFLKTQAKIVRAIILKQIQPFESARNPLNRVFRRQARVYAHLNEIAEATREALGTIFLYQATLTLPEKTLPLMQLIQTWEEEIAFALNARFDPLSHEGLHALVQQTYLERLDIIWKEHLSAMDHLRQGVYLTQYGQKDPKQEYKRIAFEIFETLFEKLDLAAATKVHETLLNFLHSKRMFAPPVSFSLAPQLTAKQAEIAGLPGRPGRNDPCPCGSQKRFKECHGKIFNDTDAMFT